MKRMLSVCLSVCLSVLAVNAASADVINWTVEKPEGLLTTGSFSVAHSEDADFVSNQNRGGYWEMPAGTDVLNIELDVSKFASGGANYLVFSFTPDTIGSSLAGLTNILLFGQSAENIVGVNSADRFYFYTDDLFNASENSTFISFDVNLKNTLDSWTIVVEAASKAKPVDPPTTPEPATMLIFGLGLAGLGIARRMKK